MENQPTQLDKAVKVSIIVGALIVASSIAYYLDVFLPQKEKIRMVEQQKQEQEDKQVELAKVLDLKNQQIKEYAIKKRGDCLQIYKVESDKWNNVEGYEYNEKYDTCFVMYKDQWGKHDSAACRSRYLSLLKVLNDESTYDGRSAQDFANEDLSDCLQIVTRKKF